MAERPSLRYVFAHVWMRHALFEMGAWRALLAPGGAECLRGLWDLCSQRFPDEDRSASAGLEVCSVTRHGEWMSLPVAFPRPVGVTEPFFGAVAVRQGRRRWLLWREKPHVRYFLLELALQGAERETVLGQWTPAQHLNFGGGPSPHLAPFLGCVSELLEGNVKVAALYRRPAGAGRRIDG